MKKRMMRLTLTYAILVSLVLSAPMSFAEPGAAALPVSIEQIPSTASNIGGQLIITDVPVVQESKFVSELAHHDNVVFLTAKNGDPVNAELDGRKNLIVSADRAQTVPYFAGTEGQAELSKIVRIRAAHPDLRHQAAGLLIAFLPATGYGAYYWYMTSDYLLTAGAFSWEYLVATAISLGSRHWFRWTNKVGSLTMNGALLVASLFGKTWSERAQSRWHRLGKVLAAYSLNLVSSTVLNILLGLHEHQIGFSTFVFLFALFSSNEVVDYHSEALLKEEGRVRLAMISRLAFYSGVELAALSGYQPAEILAGTSVMAAIISFIFQDETKATFTSLGSWARRKWTSVSSRTRKLCSDLLTLKPAE